MTPFDQFEWDACHDASTYLTEYKLTQREYEIAVHQHVRIRAMERAGMNVCWRKRKRMVNSAIKKYRKEEKYIRSYP